MRRQFATNCLIAFVLSVALLMTLALSAPGGGVKAKAAPCQSESTSKAEALLKEALILSGTSDTRLARERLSEAMSLWIQMREPEKAAQSSVLMGDAYKRMKRFQESLYYYKQSLEVKPLSNQIRAIAFNSIARVYAELYHPLARRYYEKAAELARTARNLSAQVDSLSGQALLYYQSGELKQSLAFIEQARQVNYQQGNEELDAELLHLSGRIAHKQGELNTAQEAFDKALTIYQRTGNEAEQGKVLCSISDLNLSFGQKQAAIDRAQQAVELANTLSKQANSDTNKRMVWEWQWRAFFALAHAQRAMGWKEKAIKSYFLAISRIEGVWWSVLNATNVGAVAFGEERQAPYRELVDLLIEQGQITESYVNAERAKSRSILGLIEARLMTGPARLTDPGGKLGELSRSIASLRTQLLSAQISLKQRAKIERDIEETEFALEEALANSEMERSLERNAWFRPSSVEQVQKTLITDKESVLEFFLGEKRSFAWLISSGELFIETLPGRQEIEKQVEAYLETINNRPNNLYIEMRLAKQKELAEKLFARLFGQLAERLVPGKRLIVVPDGILYYLPFETLYRNARYLVEDHEIVYLPSASLLKLLRTSKSNIEAEDKMELLAFGDSIYEPKASKTKRAAKASDETERGLRISDGFRLASLPRTRYEVNELASLFAQDRRRVYLGKDSTEDAVKAEPLRRYRRLHFASHGLIDEKDPSRSAIVMTLDSDPQEDGFLEMGEIAELDLDCDLVVLSACQSGRGRLFSGEGVVGLSRAFIYAGARSVVASLWNVSNISTSNLMKDFYHHLIGSSGSAAALREAKLQMLRSNNETRHPYYWAPFVVVGKP